MYNSDKFLPSKRRVELKVVFYCLMKKTDERRGLYMIRKREKIEIYI